MCERNVPVNSIPSLFRGGPERRRDLESADHRAGLTALFAVRGRSLALGGGGEGQDVLTGQSCQVQW